MNMKTLMLKLVAIAMAVTVCTAADEAKYVCKNTGALQITGITVTSFTANRAQAPQKSTTCASGLTAAAGKVVIAGVGTAASPYTVAEILGTSTECGVTNSGSIYTYKIIVASTANLIKASDLLFTFTCDTTAVNEVVKSASATTVSGNPTAGTVTNDVPVAMSVVATSDDATDISTAIIGTSCKLKMTLTHANNAVKKCKITTCEAAIDSGFTSPIDLFGTDGCSVTTSGVYSATTGKFTENRGASVATYISTSFLMFRFADASAVYFRCKCRGCLSTTDTACDAPTCTASRKRRDVSALRNSTVSSTVLLVLKESKAANSPVGKLEQETMVNFTNCLNHVSFISVVAILALLLVISLAVSIFFCSKLIRQRDQPKECYPNPAYKA